MIHSFPYNFKISRRSCEPTIIATHMLLDQVDKRQKLKGATIPQHYDKCGELRRCLHTLSNVSVLPYF